MNKLQLIQKAYNHSEELTIHVPGYLTEVEKATLEVLKRDMNTIGDLTTLATIKPTKERRTAWIKAKEAGVIAGLEEVQWFYETIGMQTHAHKKDGDTIEVGDLVLAIDGTVLQLLETERTGLNLLQRMSGIASTTKRLAQKIQANDLPTQIAASRKTVLFLDKKAVAVGGGLTHRLGLWDAIMIKDNHLQELKIEDVNDPIQTALTRAWEYCAQAAFIEIEVTTHEEAIHAAEVFKKLQPKNNLTPSVIMLDNIKPHDIVSIRQSLQEKSLLDAVILEASGNITEKNILDYAKTEIDVASMGSITHSAIALDLSQMIV